MDIPVEPLLWGLAKLVAADRPEPEPVRGAPEPAAQAAANRLSAGAAPPGPGGPGGLPWSSLVPRRRLGITHLLLEFQVAGARVPDPGVCRLLHAGEEHPDGGRTARVLITAGASVQAVAWIGEERLEAFRLREGPVTPGGPAASSP